MHSDRLLHRALHFRILLRLVLASIVCLGFLVTPGFPQSPPSVASFQQDNDQDNDQNEPDPTDEPDNDQDNDQNEPDPTDEPDNDQDNDQNEPDPTDEPEPTEPPVPTVVPTNPPTAEPTDPPVPTTIPTDPPIREPVQPTIPQTSVTTDEADITCEDAGDAATPTTGSAEWSLFECTLKLDFGEVSSIDIRATTESPGWKVILVEPDAVDTAGLLDASNNRLELDSLDDQQEATFLVGANLSCTAFTSASLEFEIAATRPGIDTATVETTGKVSLTARADPAPNVTLESLTFDERGDATTGTIAVAWRDAPQACDWQLLVTFGNVESGTLAIDSITGPDDARASLTSGAISILIPASGDNPTDGTIEIVVSIAGDAAAPIDAVIVEAFSFP